MVKHEIAVMSVGTLFIDMNFREKNPMEPIVIGAIDIFIISFQNLGMFRCIFL